MYSSTCSCCRLFHRLLSVCRNVVCSADWDREADLSVFLPLLLHMMSSWSSQMV